MYKIFQLVSLFAFVGAQYKYETKKFQVPLDHFGFQRNETFSIKYLVNEDNWDRENGPIFFYTGNEGQIDVFTKHTGFVWEIAPQFRAKIVFAEHRYYGESMPFGKDSWKNENIGYLSTPQVLADYVDLINYLQGNSIKPKYPVIAFGGSYGGMLATYMRLKYPHIVNGAIASSAPIHMFTGMSNCNNYYCLATSNFKDVNKNCSSNIRDSWSVIRHYSLSANGSEWLHQNWNLCGPVKNSTDVDLLVQFLKNMYAVFAIVNYPFAFNFLMPLPAEPVRYVCQYLEKKLAGEELLKAIGKVLEVYTNYGKKKRNCTNFKQTNYESLDTTGWDYQICTEMVMPMCTNGKTDMFEPMPWNYTAFAEDCHKKYNVYPRPEMARIEYGGDRLQAASNIVFSNGLKDPWTAGGILDSLSETIYAEVIPDAAHQLDLLSSSPHDAEHVKMTRQIHKQQITRWINQFQKQQNNIRPPHKLCRNKC